MRHYRTPETTVCWWWLGCLFYWTCTYNGFAEEWMFVMDTTMWQWWDLSPFCLQSCCLASSRSIPDKSWPTYIIGDDDSQHIKNSEQDCILADPALMRFRDSLAEISTKPWLHKGDLYWMEWQFSGRHFGLKPPRLRLAVWVWISMLALGQ